MMKSSSKLDLRLTETALFLTFVLLLSAYVVSASGDQKCAIVASRSSTDTKTLNINDDGGRIMNTYSQNAPAGTYPYAICSNPNPMLSCASGEPGRGILAINTHKSTYAEQEEAFIGISVLDNEGAMVCDADLTLTITDPDGATTTLRRSDGTIKMSPECHVYGATDLPDFYAYYAVKTEGEYEMDVVASGNGIATTAKDTFEVRRLIDFDVARNGPTRIYPPAEYRMDFTVKPLEDYCGPVKEYVPPSFEVMNQEGMTVTSTKDAKILQWEKRLDRGEIYEFGYEFSAPDISPGLLKLGPLEIGGWSEARRWMIAGDAVNNWKPTDAIHSDASNVTANVNASDGNEASVNKNQYVTVSSWNETVPGSRILSQVIAKVEVDAAANGAVTSILTNNLGSFVQCGSCASAVDFTGTLTCNLTGNCSIDTRAELNALNLRVNDSDPGGASGSTSSIDYIFLEVTWESDAVNPVASMGTNPTAGYTDSDGDQSITFDLKCSDNSEVGAIQVWGNWSGAWSAKATNSTPTNDSWWNVTISGIPEGTWKWDAWCNDTAGNSDWSDVNRTFSMKVSPSVTNAAATQKVRNATAVSISATITDSDGVSVARAIVSYSNGTFWQNLTMTGAGDTFSNQTTIIAFYPVGVYNVTIWANDTLGLINSTEKTWFVPYAYASDEQEIVANGSFADWAGVSEILDNVTDAGGPDVVDNELLIGGIGAAGNLSIFSYNSTASQYVQVWNDYNASIGAAKPGARMGDINHDGKNEFVMMRGASTPNLKIEVWAFNSSSQGWYRQWVGSTIFTTGNSYIGDIADVDNDTYTEMLVTNDNTHAIEIWGNDTANATGYAYNATIWTNSSGCYYPKVSCDLDGDGIPEIIAQCRFESRAQIYEWNGAIYQWKANLTLPLGGETAPQLDDMECGDVDRDSKKEVVACGNMGLSLVIDYSVGSYSLAYISSYGTAASSYTQTCSIADVTNDGWPDWFDVSKEGARVFSHDGNNYFSLWNSSKYSSNPPIGASGAGDSDNDGRGEFIYGNATAPIIAFLWENDTSPAVAFANTFTWTSTTSLNVIVGDLDNNGSAPGRDVNFEIVNYSLANNASYLFARLGVNGSITLTDGTKYYRMFVSIGTTGNQTTPENEALPFKYDYRVQVNGSQCYVFSDDNYGTNVSSCLFGYSGGQLEIAVELSDLGLSAGDNANITFETGSSTGKYDFAPDYPSFVSYGPGGGAQATLLACSIMPSCGGGNTTLLYLENETGGYFNAHAQTVSVGTYPYMICCNSSSSLALACGEGVFLRLYATTNSHVQKYGYSGPGPVYGYDVCLTASPGYFTCSYSDDACDADWACIASMASAYASENNETNAHLGPCDEYRKKICCNILTELTVTYVSPTPQDGSRQVANGVTVNVSVTSDASTTIDTCVLEWKVGSDAAVNETMQKRGSGNSVTCDATKATVDATSYTFKVYANTTTGIAGNENARTFRENGKPNKVVLSSPNNQSHTTSRQPTFTWAVPSDADGDTLNYTINISCFLAGVPCPSDDRIVTDIATNSYTPAELKYFGDDNYYYNWSVRAGDGYEFGQWSDVWKLTIDTNISIIMLNSSVDFGANRVTGYSNDTSDDSPLPLSIRNVGNCMTDINLSATDLLWDSVPNPSSYFTYKVDNFPTEGGAFNYSGSQTSWANIPDTNTSFVKNLNYTAGNRSVEVDLGIIVPQAEPPGTKSATILFAGEYHR
jgi:hypothetical protein